MIPLSGFGLGQLSGTERRSIGVIDLDLAAAAAKGKDPLLEDVHHRV